MNTHGKLGLGSGVAVCVGLIVATSCLVSLGTGVGLSGKAFIIPLFAVVILNAFIALSFSELHRMMPRVEGGVGQYSLVGMGPVASLISNISAYVITMVLASSAEAAMCGLVLNEFFPKLPAAVLSIGILVIIGGINFFGVDIFSKVQNLVVILLIGSMFVMGIISFFGLGTGEYISAAEQTAPAITGIGNVMGLAAIAFWLFIGVEFIIPVAKDLKNPRRDVLLSMIIALVLLFISQGMLGVGMTHYVSLDALASSTMPHMLFATALFGFPGKVWMGIITLLAGISTMNTVLASSARIVSGMAEENLVPKVFKTKNKYATPVLGLLLIACADIVLIISGYVYSSGIINVILAASCFWLMSYIMTHANVLILRKRYPDADRNKKLVFLGIPQILGILGNVYMIWNISSDMKARLDIYKIFGIILIILVSYAFIWVVGVMKVKPFTPVSMDQINADAIAFEKEGEADTEMAL